MLVLPYQPQLMRLKQCLRCGVSLVHALLRGKSHEGFTRSLSDEI